MGRIRVRSKSILLSPFEILPDRDEVAPRDMDEVQVQLSQSQLEESRSMVSQRCTKIGHLVQTCCDGFVYIPRIVFRGDVEIGPVFEQ